MENRNASSAQKVFNYSLKIIKPKAKEEFDPLSTVRLYDIHKKLNYPEPKWFVKPFLPEGLSILAGKPKLGKSLFALRMAISIAWGLKFMKSFSCERSTVYFIPYEDSLSRIKFRVSKMLGKMYAPKNIIIPPQPEKFPRLTNGGLAAIKKIIKYRKDIGVIIIDTFGRFVNKSNYGNQSFQEDYDLLYSLQTLAVSNHISILLVHHTTKKEAEDPFDEIQGTMGIQASPDSLMLMKKRSGHTELYVRGRDYEDTSYSLKFNQKKLSWEIMGDIRENGLSREAKATLNLFKDNKLKTFKLSEVKQIMKDSNLQNTSNKLSRLVSKELIEKDGRGFYKLNLETFKELVPE